MHTPYKIANHNNDRRRQGIAPCVCQVYPMSGGDDLIPSPHVFHSVWAYLQSLLTRRGTRFRQFSRVHRCHRSSFLFIVFLNTSFAVCIRAPIHGYAKRARWVPANSSRMNAVEFLEFKYPLPSLRKLYEANTDGFRTLDAHCESPSCASTNYCVLDSEHQRPPLVSIDKC